MGAKNNLGCYSSYTVHLALETGSLTGLDLTKWAKLAGHGVSGNSLTLALSYWDYKHVLLHLAFSHGLWRSKLRSSGLCDKCFSQCAISQTYVTGFTEA